jgi:galactoside O-acetyltransferase
MVRLRKKQFNTSAYLDTCVRINSKINFLAGNNCALYHNTYIQNDNGQFLMGNRSHLGAYCYVNVFRGKCIIGDDVSIGPGTKVIVYSNHYQKGKKNTEIRICEDISIGNNVFIGANCVILPGTQIGDNVVVGAGSVVKGTLDENGVYAGSIVKKLKSL